MSRSIIKSSVAVAIAVLVGISGWSTGWIPFLPAVHAQGAAQVVVSPSSIASLTSLPGSTVTFEVDTANSSPFAGFEVGFFYNISVLQNPRVDYTANALGNDATLLSECINGLGDQCTFQKDFDGQGVVSLSLETGSGVNTTTTNGKLFSVTFTVATIGFSPVHIVKSLLGTEPNGNFLPVVAHDGYFTNMDCPRGSGILCRPPVVSFSVPQNVAIGNLVTFDASASSSQNPNGTITQYVWVWRFGFDRSFLTTTSPLTTHNFPFFGVWTVTLIVRDNYGTSAIETLLINVENLRLSVSMFFTDSDLNSLQLTEFEFPTPTVNVTISGGVVRTVNPRHVLAWVNITNSGAVPFQSLKLNHSLPVDWTVDPPWLPGKGAVHVYYANSTSLATNPEITQTSTITVPTGDPSSIQVAIPSFNATGIGHPLMPGQSILLSVNLSYNLVGTAQSAATYPRLYFSEANTEAWTTSGFVGNKSTDIGKAELGVRTSTVGQWNYKPAIV